MDEKEVKICWLTPENEGDLRLPGYETPGAAGMDVEAGVVGELIILPGEMALVPTGFGVELPAGYELQVRPRSGLAVKYGLTILNSPGTIDSDYRGEVKIALINLGQKPFSVHRGDRIAQLVLKPVTRARFVLVEGLNQTPRAAGGFGHTGV
ncbi:MAG: dUTP diphosphatase [Proteobacteria bacterium]|nr:dUTP diphosphatase [Pseudomonadota bacterium]